MLAYKVFVQFQYLNVSFNEDQVRRIFNGNGINQLGLFNYAQKPDYQKEILKMLADGFDVMKNWNFEIY
jgi:hypothetical protein